MMSILGLARHLYSARLASASCSSVAASEPFSSMLASAELSTEANALTSTAIALIIATTYEAFSRVYPYWLSCRPV